MVLELIRTSNFLMQYEGKNLHNQRKEVRGHMITLPEPSFTFKPTINITINTERIWSTRHTRHNPYNDLPVKIKSY